jgi:hypothetical protein
MAAWWGAVAFAGMVLALELATGIVPIHMSPYSVRRQKDPAPNWLGVFWTTLAIAIVLILAVIHAFGQ